MAALGVAFTEQFRTPAACFVASTAAVSALGAAPTWLGEGGLCVDLARALRGDFALLVVSLVCDVALLPGILQPTTSRRLQPLQVRQSVALAVSI